MAKVKLGLGTLSPEEIVALTNTIITAMTGNAKFTTPNPTLAALGTLRTTAATKIDAYNAALAAVEAAKSERDAAIAALCASLTQEGAYVDNISGGDKATIESAGMGVRANGAPVTLTQVLELVLAPGDNEGTLLARWRAVKGAYSYEVQISADPMTPTSWTPKMTASKASALLNSLSSGAKVWVRVRAIGADNQTGPWSDPAVKTVP